MHLTPSATRRKLAERHLMRCPLCETLNARQNDECFVCGWSGGFDHDGARIEDSLIRLTQEMPGLDFEEPVRPRPLTPWQKLRARLKKRLDLEA